MNLSNFYIVIIVGVLYVLNSCSNKEKKDISKTYYHSGTVKEFFEIENGIPNGKYTMLHPNGTIAFSCNLTDNKLTGVCSTFYDTGKLLGIYNYANGIKEGHYTNYFQNSNLAEKGYYKNDRIVEDNFQFFENYPGKLKYKLFFLNIRGQQSLINRIEYDSNGNIVKQEQPLTITGKGTISEKDTLLLHIKINDPIFDRIKVHYDGFNENFYVIDSSKTITRLSQGNEIIIKVAPLNRGVYFLRGYVEDYKIDKIEKPSEKDSVYTTISHDYYFQYKYTVK